MSNKHDWDELLTIHFDLPFFSSCFTVKRSPSLEDPSFGDGIVKVVLVSRCFSCKVKLASHASRNYKHGEDELINDIIKRLLVRQKKKKNLCRLIRKRLISASKPEETLPAISRT